MSDANWTASDLRKALVKKASNGKIGADPSILSAPTKQTALALQNYVMYYDADDPDNPDDIESDAMYQLLFSRLETVTAWDSTRSGDVSSMRGIAGSQYEENSIEMASWNEYEKIKDLFRQSPEYTDFTNSIFQCVLFSSAVPPTGRGKSNSAYTLIEIAQSVFPDLRVITNNTSDDFETTPEQWVDLEATIKEDSDQWKILLVDEAAQFLQYADQGAGKSISQRMKLLRHNRCHIIMVGHTGMDIPADIRRQMFFIDKQSKKKAIFGYGLDSSSSSGNTMNVAEEIFRINDMPATTVDYDDIDDEGIEIKFDQEEDETKTVDEKSPEYISEQILEDGVEKYVSDNYGQKYIDGDSIELDYDIGSRRSKKVKKLIKREIDIEEM